MGSQSFGKRMQSMDILQDFITHISFGCQPKTNRSLSHHPPHQAQALAGAAPLCTRPSSHADSTHFCIPVSATHLQVPERAERTGSFGGSALANSHKLVEIND